MTFPCFDRMVGGKGEAYANVAEGLATAIQCFEDLKLKRDGLGMVQKHCVLVGNSPPYLLPVMETPSFSGKNVDDLASLLQEVSIYLIFVHNLSVFLLTTLPSLSFLFLISVRGESFYSFT